MHTRSVIKQPLLHAIYLKPSVLLTCLGKMHVDFETTVLFELMPPSEARVVSHCCVHIWKSLNVILDCKQQFSYGIFKAKQEASSGKL